MKNNKFLLLFSLGFLLVLGVIISSCKKDTLNTSPTPTPFPTPTANASFVEEFDTVGNLPAKGWVFRNNSNPVGANGWRQGRYEPATMVQYSFLAPVAYVGFQAYSATTSPNDFVSCDVTAGNDAVNGAANYSAWLISPTLPIKNGDQVSFWTRAVDDNNYAVYCKDRMQVRANFTDGSTQVGDRDTSLGSFRTLLLDINPTYIYNDPAGNGGAPGYPRTWTKYTITFSGIPGGAVTNGRFAFRYLGVDAGLFGGLAGTNYPTVVGVDQLTFTSK